MGQCEQWCFFGLDLFFLCELLYGVFILGDFQVVVVVEQVDVCFQWVYFVVYVFVVQYVGVKGGIGDQWVVQVYYVGGFVCQCLLNGCGVMKVVGYVQWYVCCCLCLVCEISEEVVVFVLVEYYYWFFVGVV